MRRKGLPNVIAVLSLSLMMTASALAQSTPSAGDLVINEIMYNPSTSEPSTEWFEVKNVSGGQLDLSGCTLKSGSSTHSISTSTILNVDEYFVFGRNGVPFADFTYSSLQLNNSGTDDITITCGSSPEVTIDSVTYGTTLGAGWPASTNGKSISFGVPTGQTNYTTLNDSGSNWKLSTSDSCCVSGTDFGTPGAKNDDVLGATAITTFSFTAYSGQRDGQPERIQATVSDRSTMVLLGGVVLLAAAGLTILKRRQPTQ